MELWRLYKFVRFAKVQIGVNTSLNKLELQNAFRGKTGAEANDAFDLWDGSVEREYIEDVGRVHIRTKGRQLLEGRIGPVSLGLFIEELKIYWILVIVIFGSSSIYGFINWIWHI